ncbi:DUF1146 domain-containing protein [Paenibacillus sp. 1011MAR3C5]|uniref:DUF1146 domain-containing protein n=1 Tax=Paenibacillus sp. 1011MAR3C5 TaxID=1675787 RepID=UPI002175A7E4|nr:DUF1146 domain-containing protein [Paenibacillus sp. 1011MAR3C5]
MATSNDFMGDFLRMNGLTGLFSIVVELLSILLVWMLIREVKWETFFHFPNSRKAQVLKLLLTVALGHLFAQFILQYWNYTVMLKTFVE